MEEITKVITILNKINNLHKSKGDEHKSMENNEGLEEKRI